MGGGALHSHMPSVTLAPLICVDGSQIPECGGGREGLCNFRWRRDYYESKSRNWVQAFIPV